MKWPFLTICRSLLPPALIQGHPGYLRALHGVQPLGDTWLNIAAFDLARGPDGGWRVVSQRTQAPSGLGYLPSPAAYIEVESSAEYRKAYAEYQRLLASPAYKEAVAKYQSGTK